MKVKSVVVKLDSVKIGKLKKASDKALEKTAEAILSDIKTRGVVPKDTGELERSGFEQKAKGVAYRIIFNTPYARRWYFNLPDKDSGKKATFQKTKNANAQDHWMDYYLDGEGKAWVINAYKQFFEQEAGGLI